MHADEKNNFTLSRTDVDGGGAMLTLSGRLVVETLKGFLVDGDRLFKNDAPSSVTVNLAGLSHLDSAGALALIRMKERAREQAIPFTLEGTSREAEGLLAIIIASYAGLIPPLHEGKVSEPFLEVVGESALSLGRDFVSVMTFLGELVTALGASLFRPRSIRWGDVVFYMKKSGAEALPIVGLISLLIGLIMAFMSSLQLKQFGANIYVASLVSIAIVKELGPMMTAIIVAGRSGSAFAAEIGTMMVNEEVDALTTMGFDPIRFLAVPKVIAAMAVVPLLTLYAMLFGITGGLLVGVIGLDLTVNAYVHQSLEGLDLFDLVTSLVKSGVFATLIAGIGCQRGFKVLGGAEAVGEATTSAVVSAIFLIIIADSAFAILLHYIH